MGGGTEEGTAGGGERRPSWAGVGARRSFLRQEPGAKAGDGTRTKAPGRWTRTPTRGVQRPRRDPRCAGQSGSRAGLGSPGPAAAVWFFHAWPCPPGRVWGSQAGARLDLRWEAEDRISPSF